MTIASDNNEHQLMLLRVVNRSGDVVRAKSLSESMLARGDDLSEDMRAQVERIYAESARE